MINTNPNDIRNLSKQEIIDNANIYAKSNMRDKYFWNILCRDDKEEIIPLVFTTFLKYPTEMLYIRIANKKYADVFKSLIKDNLNEILMNLIDEKILDDEDEVLDDARKARRNSRLLKDFMTNYSDIVYENIDILINNNPYFVKILSAVSGYEGFKDAILKNKILIIEKLNYHLNHSGGSNREIMIREDSVFLFTMLSTLSSNEIEKNKELVIESINSVLNKLNVNSFKEGTIDDNKNHQRALLLNCFSDIAKKDDDINQMLNDNIDFVLSMFTGQSIESLEKEEILEFFKEIFMQVTYGKELDFSDVKYASGFNSAVAIVGDKILKTGEKATVKIPYHRRFLQPVVKEEIDLINGYGTYTLFEIYEKVDTKGITDDEAYMVFKELLEDNIFWADAKSSNLGRLIKPNRPYVEDAYVVKKSKAGNVGEIDDKKNYYVDRQTAGFTGKRKEEILDTGEIVVTDLDCVYDFDLRGINLEKVIEKEVKADPYFNYRKFIDKYLLNDMKDVAAVEKNLTRYIGEVIDKLDRKKASY